MGNNEINNHSNHIDKNDRSIRKSIKNGEEVFAAIDIVENFFSTPRPGEYWREFKRRFKDNLTIYNLPCRSNKTTTRVCKVDFLTGPSADFLLSYKKFSKAENLISSFTATEEIR